MNIAVIPARFASTRFPGKPLALIDGRPMIWHVYQRCLRAKRIDATFVATDDERILREVGRWGGEAVMTRRDHPSGTDRVAEVAGGLSAEIVVNVQGDEPLIDPTMIDALIEALQCSEEVGMTTPVTRVKNRDELFDPTVAKVVRDARGCALYFSRSPIPFVRDHPFFSPGDDPSATVEWPPDLPLFRHIGIYAYRRKALLEFCRLSPSPLEEAEKLEQLRALENGIPILTVEVAYDGIGVDTPEDLKEVERRLRASHASP